MKIKWNLRREIKITFDVVATFAHFPAVVFTIPPFDVRLLRSVSVLTDCVWGFQCVPRHRTFCFIAVFTFNNEFSTLYEDVVTT